MNRLQKKCVIATAGFHLLLLVILFVGPAFFYSKPKADDSPVLDVIPASLVDAVVNCGVKNAAPPAPAPLVMPPPAPPAPKPLVQPAPAPQPTITERLEKFFTPEPARPAPAQTENQPCAPKVNLTPVTRFVPDNFSTPKPKDNSQLIQRTLLNLRHQLSSATTVDVPGDSGASAANYKQVVKSIYEQAWILPDDMVSDEANTKVRVTIASDGTVISARIITPSGDAKLDASVQQTLDRVQFIAPFPPGTTDTERTYIINFNPQIKRMLG
jgi:TonB family protein